MSRLISFPWISSVRRNHKRAKCERERAKLQLPPADAITAIGNRLRGSPRTGVVRWSFRCCWTASRNRLRPASRRRADAARGRRGRRQHSEAGQQKHISHSPGISGIKSKNSVGVGSSPTCSLARHARASYRSLEGGR